MENAGFIFAVVMLGGGWLLEIWGARKVAEWLKANNVEHPRSGWFYRVKNAVLYWRHRGKNKQPPTMALVYIFGLLTSYGGIFLLLYLKATSRI